MYSAYFVNSVTGQLMKTGDPKDNPSGNEWKGISYKEFSLFAMVATWANRQTNLYTSIYKSTDSI